MIIERKLTHMLGVARECREIAKRIGFSEEQQDAAFVMGLLHDVGYEKCVESTDDVLYHPERGAEMVRNFAVYKDDCIRAILTHGTSDCETAWEYIINLADLTVGPGGVKMTVAERLDDITTRYGENGIQTINSRQQIEAIRNTANTHGDVK